jgi:hypothetical protein
MRGIRSELFAVRAQQATIHPVAAKQGAEF